MQKLLIAIMLALVSVGSNCFDSKSIAKAPAPAKEKVAAVESVQDAGSAQREKKIKSMMRSTLRSFASAKLTQEQQQQADLLFGKAIKSYVNKRADAQITDELQKKHAECLKEDRASTAKEQSIAAFACAGFTEEQIKVFESTRKALDKAKRDFQKQLTDRQIVGLPKSLQKSLKGDQP